MKKGFTLIELMIVIAIIAIIAAIAIPNLIEARKHGNEAAAIGALKTIVTNQTLFSQSDKDGDNDNEFGGLSDLYTTGLLDGVLGLGTKQGYLFDCDPHTTQPNFLWSGVANPSVAGTTGDRSFAVNQGGVVYYTSNDTGTSNIVTDISLCTETGIGAYQPVGK